jgi:type IV pilus assembly protein PilV
MRKISGISLIEMLIALVIIAVGLLGVAGLQTYSLKNNTSAYQRSQVNALIYDIFDAMRTNRTEALNGAYQIDFAASYSPGSTRSSRDIASWLDRVRDPTILPAGDGRIVCANQAGLMVCVVTVQWDDTRGQNPPQEMTVSMAI